MRYYFNALERKLLMMTVDGAVWIYNKNNIEKNIN